MFGEVKNANLRNNKVSSSYHQFDPLSKKIINFDHAKHRDFSM
jgi:hypothetical protein